MRSTMDTPSFKKDFQRSLASNLPLLRAKLNLSQHELAEMVGTTRQTISFIERGTREMMWDTCLSLTFLFASNENTRDLLEPLGIHYGEMLCFLRVSSGQE